MRKIEVTNRETEEVVYGNCGGPEFYATFDADLVQYQDTEKFSISDVDISVEIALKRVIEDRRSEYTSMDDVLHAILDGTLDDIQAKRALVKAKYPKPE